MALDEGFSGAGIGIGIGSSALVQRQKQMLQSLLQQEKAVLEELCEFNDVSTETLLQDPGGTTRLEMFMYNFPRIRCLGLFTGLTSLALMQQSFRSIEGLESCVNLESLWLCENKIERIDGLEKCLKLRELYLHSNQISRIENVSHLTALESLWLANNRIEQIDGLRTLTRLRILNLARNPISSVGAALLSNRALETLNLADTKIGSFKEIAHLARLPSLTELYLSDPHWGQSPVAQLCNFQTYALFHIGGLRVLDALEVGDEARGAAEGTYMKKRMYYNMKIKTLQRKTSDGVKLAQEGKAAQVAQAQAVLAALTRLQKDIEQELQSLPPDRASDASRIKKHRAAIAAVDSLVAKIDDIEWTFDRCKREAYELGDVAVRRLKLELETGGNTRLEEGKPSDVWSSSCSELVASRFSPADFARFGITGVRVTGVTRVHNRSLRSRFEAAVEEKVNTNDPEYKRALEYLFTAGDPAQPDCLQHVAEDGFTDGVILTNSLGLADMPRLQECTQSPASPRASDVSTRGGSEYDDVNANLRRKLSGLTGKLLVSKVFVGRTQQIGSEETGFVGNPKSNPVNGRAQNGFLPNSALRPSSRERSGSGEHFRLKDRLERGVLNQSDHPGVDSVFLSQPGDDKQCTWAVFDSAFVLPEYLVEYEYIVERGLGVLGQAVVKAGRPFVSEADAARKITEETEGLGRVAPEVRTVCRPLGRFLADIRLPRGRSSASPGICTDSAYLELLKMAPALTTRAKTLVLSEETVARNCHVAAAGGATCLNLHNNSIRKIEALLGLASLRILVLSFNSIQKLEGLEGLTQLEKLDLSYNYVKRIDGLKGLHALRTLDLTANQIYKLDDVSTLKRSVPLLASLSLRNNPVTDSRAYHETVFRKLKHLTELDGRPITGHFTSLPEGSSSITPSMLHEALAAQNRGIQPGETAPVDSSYSTLGGSHRESMQASEGGSSRDGGAAGRRLTQGFGDVSRNGNVSRNGDIGRNGREWGDAGEESEGALAGCSGRDLDRGFGEVLELALEHRRLRGLGGLESLVKIRRLSLRDNEIADVEPLKSLSSLEELNLEENQLVKIDGLEYLTRLRKLELGKNRIASCETLAKLTGLTQLSLEDNEITSLQPLASLTSLMELYCANNRVAAIKQVLALRDLPRLIILDASGNAVCADAEYRPYTLFSLRRLKILDGLGVDSGEQAQTVARYTGRLTKELLEERTSRSSFEGIKELDLSDMKLRDCGTVFSGGAFSGLTELRLDSNGLSDVSGLRYLSRLVVLRLDNNKVDDLPLVESASAGRSGPVESPGEIFASLEVLHLAGNAITSIAALKLHRFAKLAVLTLQDNEIVKIDGLDGLSRLEKLVLDRNKIKAADGPSFLDTVRLRELRLEENALRTLAHFAPLKALRHLNLAGNRIAELPELDKLAGLTGLTKLSLVNNQITRRQLYRQTAIARVRNLQTLDGTRITAEERELAEDILGDSADFTPPGSAGIPAILSGGPVNKISLKVNTMQLEFLGPTGPGQPTTGGIAPDPTRLLESVKGLEVLRIGDQSVKAEKSARGKTDLRRSSSLPLSLTAVRKVDIGLDAKVGLSNRVGTPLGRTSVDDFARLINGSVENRGKALPGVAKRDTESSARRASEFPGRMLVVRPLSRERSRPARLSTGAPQSKEAPIKRDNDFAVFSKGLSLKDYYSR